MRNNKLKINFFFICILTIFAASVINNTSISIWSGLIQTMSWGWYCALFLLLIMFNSFNIFSELEKNYSILIRYENIGEFYRKSFKTILYIDIIIFIITVLFNLLAIYFNVSGNMGFDDFLFYNIKDITYLVFYSFRFFIICYIISIISILIYKLLGKTYSVLFIALSSMLLTGGVSNTSPITSVFDLRLYHGFYFSIIKYSGFIFEICMSLLYISILLVVCNILYSLIIKYKKGV
jgi:hypothetical protein